MELNLFKLRMELARTGILWSPNDMRRLARMDPVFMVNSLRARGGCCDRDGADPGATTLSCDWPRSGLSADPDDAGLNT